MNNNNHELDSEEIIEQATLDVLFNTDQVEIPTDQEYFIDGYLVDHVVPYEAVRVPGLNLPLYKKRINSNTIYCAGYYCVKCESTWKYGNCLMLNTLMATEYKGPFHTKEKVLSVLAEIKKTN